MEDHKPQEEYKQPRLLSIDTSTNTKTTLYYTKAKNGRYYANVRTSKYDKKKEDIKKLKKQIEKLRNDDLQ